MASVLWSPPAETRSLSVVEKDHYYCMLLSQSIRRDVDLVVNSFARRRHGARHLVAPWPTN